MRVYVCMYVWMDRWMDGWVDGWMDGWIQGAPLIYFNDGEVRVIFLGLKFWPKVIFLGL